MEDKLPKFVRWLALILYRARMDTMKLYGATDALHKSIAGFLIVLLFSGSTLAVYIVREMNFWQSLLAGLLLTWLLTAVFVTPFKLFDELGGLDTSLAVEIYNSQLAKDGEQWVGLKVKRNATPAEIQADIIEMYIMVDSHLQPYPQILENGRLEFSQTSLVKENGSMTIYPEFPVFVKIAEIKDFSLWLILRNTKWLDKDNSPRYRFIDSSLKYRMKVAISGKTLDGKKIKPYIKTFDLIHPGRAQLTLEESAVQHGVHSTGGIHPPT